MSPFWGVVFVVLVTLGFGVWYVFKTAKDKAGGPPSHP